MKKGIRSVVVTNRTYTQEQRQALVERYRSRHRVKELQDGTKVVECLCGKTIAMTKQMDQHLCVEVRLQGHASRFHLSTINSGGKCLNPKCQRGHDLGKTLPSLLGYDTWTDLLEAVKTELKQTSEYKKYLLLQETEADYLISHYLDYLAYFHFHEKYLLRQDTTANPWAGFLAEITDRCEQAIAHTKLA